MGGVSTKKDTERILLNSVDLSMIKSSFNDEVKVKLDHHCEKAGNLSTIGSAAFQRDTVNSSQGIMSGEVRAGSGKISDAGLTQYAFRNQSYNLGGGISSGFPDLNG